MPEVASTQADASECEQLAALVENRWPARGAMVRKNWRRYSSVVEFFMAHARPQPGQLVLDYGCGFPFVAAMLIRRGVNVRAYEPYATDEESGVAEALGLRDHFCTQLPPGETFSHVLLVDVIEHL